MAGMLAAVLAASPRPRSSWTSGCGDGAAAGLAAQRNPGHHLVGLDWSAGALARPGGSGLTVVRAGVDAGLPVAHRPPTWSS